MKIDEQQDADYETVTISGLGLIDHLGVIVLKSIDGKEFHMTAFSAEVAQYIANFMDGKREQVPTIYNMFEQMCEENELVLVKVKIYETGGIFRANLYFTGKKDVLLKYYRASDAVTLATFYNVPILVRKDLLKEPEPEPQIKSPKNGGSIESEKK
ncbi:bifunctional nuclease family protein [Candidatus Nitrosotenuis aquarius]|jgi:bifunctional DNase/RNase|uniref:bifunctional nuclease family protein n=1 Tax=Candidatus Nitrosotenuis aquarius TaxID=1846278 RepID=UPI000C1E2931|nr:bifunctional nuclease domain-containing protein [Candidatus Nitrosotenuis aquarius]